MVTQWTSANNVLNVDFKLYGSYSDLLNGRNAWAYCNYDGANIPFPRDCGPTVAGSTQYTGSTAAANYAYYVVAPGKLR